MKTLITCHANADCDAFAAMIAARLLYDSPILLFPGTQEAGLARIYAALDKDAYGFREARAIKWDQIDRLVIVDTRQKVRVAHVEQLLNSPNVRIEIWDHHPPTQDDIRADIIHYGQTGAVTSLICGALEERKCQPAPVEATLMGLGIYGDTGSFTYSSTSTRDFAAASWLLENGMDTVKISDMAGHELTSLHIRALNSLLESARTYFINDIPVVLAEASMDHYLGDFAILAHKLLEMEKFSVLFAIGIMGDHIQIVARSRNDSINVGEICAELGGGGHAYAASACVRDMTPNEVRDKILRGISARGGAEKKARDLMSSPPLGVGASSSMRDADELMLHFGLKAVPVFQDGTKICVGLLDAQTAARACAHGLATEKVSEYMRRRLSALEPDAGIRDLAQVIIGGRQRLVPIVENGEVVGVVTRTDLINILATESGVFSCPEIRDHKQKNVRGLIEERLPAQTRRILTLAGELGASLNLPVYAVGGFARDLLLNYPNHDIDLVAEGNGIALARALAEQLGGRVRIHEKFKTSVVIYHDAEGIERHIDVATARLEYYEYPAALPTVELSSIKMDLFRRDFSINSLAVRLDGDHYATLVDFFGAQRDIRDRIIRVLHTLSFVEDPTRCIRAVRFEQRYKFRIGVGTEKLIRNILPMRLLEKLSAHRLFNEFRLLCEEENAADCLVRLDELGILKSLNPRLALNPARQTLLKKMKRVISWYRLLFFEEPPKAWICYFLVLCRNLNYAEASANFDSLGLPENKKNWIMRQREELRKVRPRLLKWQHKHDAGVAKISDFCELLRNIDPEFLIYGMAVLDEPGLEKNISLFITRWSHEKADINGRDLRRLGVPPGPLYARLLRLALLAKLDGKAPNHKSQLALVAELLKKDGEAAQSTLAGQRVDV